MSSPLFNGDLKTYDRAVTKNDLADLKAYDLSWTIEREMATTDLKVGKFKTFMSYSIEGVLSSQNKKKASTSSYIRLQDPEDFKTAHDNLEFASRWVTERCIEFWELTKNHIYGMYQIPPEQRDAVRIIIGSGLSELQSGDPNFINKGTFFMGKFTKYEQWSEEKKKVKEIAANQMGKNSFFLINISIKRFTIKYNAPSNEIVVKCFVNVGRLTYMDQALPGVVPVDKTHEDDLDVGQVVGNLKELIAKKKRKDIT